MSGYQYNGIDLNNIVYNDGSDNTQGYNKFPGTKTNPGTSENIGINNYVFQTNINLLSSRLPFFIDYNNSVSSVNWVTGSNAISVLIIGASGGGGGGGGVNTAQRYSGGGGGQGGLYNVHMTNKIPRNIFPTRYSIEIGNGGTGGDAGVTGVGTSSTSGGDGNAGNNTIIGFYYTANTNLTIIRVNGGGGGNKGNKATGTANGNGGTSGTDSTIDLAIGDTYILNTFVQNITTSKNSGSDGNTLANNRRSGGTSNVTQSISNVGSGVLNSSNLNYVFSNTYGRGGGGGAGGNLAGVNANATAGGNGVKGFVRVYYFFN